MRTLRPEDLFRFEQVAEMALSPDGEWLAFERVRSGNSGTVKALTIFKQTRTDIWVAPTGGGQPAAVTAGADTGTGFFRPMWSPDGKRLAMLSIREEEIRLWIWEKSSGSLFQASHLGVLGFQGSSMPNFCAWLAEDRIACLMWPEGSLEPGRLQAEETRPGSYAARYWSDSWSGETVTADVLDTGTQAQRDAKQLVVIDVQNRAHEVLAEETWGYLKLSPDAKHIVTFRPGECSGLDASRPLTPERLISEKKRQCVAGIRSPERRIPPSTTQNQRTRLPLYSVVAHGERVCTAGKALDAWCGGQGDRVCPQLRSADRGVERSRAYGSEDKRPHLVGKRRSACIRRVGAVRRRECTV